MTETGQCDRCGFVYVVGKWQHHCPGERSVAGCYGRIGYFTTTKGRCDLCHLVKVLVIKTDTSDGEYSSIQACIPCIEMLVREFNENPKVQEDK